MGHDVAPVAGGVADADEEEAVAGAGELEGFGGPKLPGGWVVHVGADVGGFALGAAVGEGDVAGGHGGVVSVVERGWYAGDRE